MIVRSVAAGAALLVVLALAGCGGATAADAGTDAEPATKACDVTGYGEGVDVEPFSSDLLDGEYPVKGNTVVGDSNPVAGVRITVEGDGFSSAVCSDKNGKWGAVMPAAPPYTVTVDESTVPDGLAIAGPQFSDDGSTIVDESLVWPVIVNVFFEGDAGTEDSGEVEAPAEASGTWGGITFPGRIGEYRLISEAEYTDFTSAYPGAIVCVLLGGPLVGETLVSDGKDFSHASFAKALYTSSSEPMAEQGCDSTETTINVTWSGTEEMGYLLDLPADANGNHCEVVATNMCVTLDGAGGGWSAADLSSEIPLDEVSDFLQAVRAGG